MRPIGDRLLERTVGPKRERSTTEKADEQEQPQDSSETSSRRQSGKHYPAPVGARLRRQGKWRACKLRQSAIQQRSGAGQNDQRSDEQKH
jgi:hypothetical protein